MTSSSKKQACALFRNMHQEEDLEDIIRENGVEKRDDDDELMLNVLRCHLTY